MLDATLVAKLKALGAQSVGGDMFIGRVKVAVLRHDQVIVTPDGEAALAQAVAAPAVAVAQTSAPAASKAKKHKPEAPAPAHVPESDPLDDLNDAP
jgi:CHASE2 domain-containing sensor protein